LVVAGAVIAEPLEVSARVSGHLEIITIQMLITAYCSCSECTGPFADGITASGAPVTANGGAFVAGDTDLLPFETWVSVPGYHAGRPVPVLDRGGAIKGYRLDVFFNGHYEALEWGRRNLFVTVYLAGPPGTVVR
jgi:3D (Asp-Asp-Asp) domain-containing protein